ADGEHLDAALHAAAARPSHGSVRACGTRPDVHPAVARPRPSGAGPVCHGSAVVAHRLILRSARGLRRLDAAGRPRSALLPARRLAAAVGLLRLGVRDPGRALLAHALVAQRLVRVLLLHRWPWALLAWHCLTSSVLVRGL